MHEHLPSSARLALALTLGRRLASVERSRARKCCLVVWGDTAALGVDKLDWLTCQARHRRTCGVRAESELPGDWWQQLLSELAIRFPAGRRSGTGHPASAPRTPRRNRPMMYHQAIVWTPERLIGSPSADSLPGCHGSTDWSSPGRSPASTLLRSSPGASGVAASASATAHATPDVRPADHASENPEGPRSRRAASSHSWSRARSGAGATAPRVVLSKAAAPASRTACSDDSPTRRPPIRSRLNASNHRLPAR
jgi:hypothetical protein